MKALTMLVILAVLEMAGCSAEQCVAGQAEHKDYSLPDPNKQGTITLSVPAGTSFALCAW